MQSYFNFQLFPDVAVRREILSLTVICNNHAEGCEWHGELRNLEVRADFLHS